MILCIYHMTVIKLDVIKFFISNETLFKLKERERESKENFEIQSYLKVIDSFYKLMYLKLV